jgi:hypothetical protein
METAASGRRDRDDDQQPVPEKMTSTPRQFSFHFSATFPGLFPRMLPRWATAPDSRLRAGGITIHTEPRARHQQMQMRLRVRRSAGWTRRLRRLSNLTAALDRCSRSVLSRRCVRNSCTFHRFLGPCLRGRALSWERLAGVECAEPPGLGCGAPGRYPIGMIRVPHPSFSLMVSWP